jgi:DNA repair exonuclease SbcCD ATPase subunit
LRVAVKIKEKNKIPFLTKHVNNNYLQEIRALENRLDKAMVKFNEAQSVRKIYEQIVKKLEQERLTFDGQLQQFERTLKSKKEDAKQLESMSRDANHAKELAKAELAKIESQIQEERKAREKTLIVRRELVKQRQQELQEKLDKKVSYSRYCLRKYYWNSYSNVTITNYNRHSKLKLPKSTQIMKPTRINSMKSRRNGWPSLRNTFALLRKLLVSPTLKMSFPNSMPKPTLTIN